jgi:hypothetical protein
LRKTGLSFKLHVWGKAEVHAPYDPQIASSNSENKNVRALPVKHIYGTWNWLDRERELVGCNQGPILSFEL